MLRARLCLPVLLTLSLVSFACVRPGTSSPGADAETDASEAGGSGSSLAIVAVPQVVLLAEPAKWSFDPSGRFVAASVYLGGCGVWDIESGAFIREFEPDAASDPCRDWALADKQPPVSSADGTLRVVVSPGAFEIEAKGAVRAFPCPSCDLAWAWAPSGHLLATSNGELVEIWDADTGKRLRSEALAIAREVEDVALGWTDEGLVVVVSHATKRACDELVGPTYCNDHYEDGNEEPPVLDVHTLSSFWWPAPDAPMQAKRELHVDYDPFEWIADPGLRWLAIIQIEDYDRDGIATTLHVIGTGGRSSGLGWTGGGWEGGGADRHGGHWRVDAVTQWLSAYAEYSGNENYADLELGWEAIVAEPNPAMYRVAVNRRGAAWGELELVTAAGGAAAVEWEEWEACDYYIPDVDEPCEWFAFEFGACELLDVAPSPALALALVDCSGVLELVEMTGRHASFAKLPFGTDAAWQWGRADNVAVYDPSKLEVFSLNTGKRLYERAGVVHVPEVPLAAEQDRLLFVYADRFELVVGSTGERVLEVAGDCTSAALSPDGRRLAVIGDGRGQVLEIATGVAISSFEVGDKRAVAWRQDGATLFYGDRWPTHMVDPATGELLADLEDHPLLLEIDPSEIDPSWRWIHRDDGSIVRTLDFARLELGPTWARTESGLFDGQLDDLPRSLPVFRFRVGDQPEAIPRWTVEELEPWLRKRGLVAAFFAGEPLPAPRIPEAEFAQLEAQLGPKSGAGG
jgi:hypothetical protein